MSILSQAETGLPVVSYLKGAAEPAAVIGCPGGGNLADPLLTLSAIVADGYPGGNPLETITAVTGGPDEVEIVWPDAMASLAPGTYGLTVIATTTASPARKLKWRGLLEIQPAS